MKTPVILVLLLGLVLSNADEVGEIFDDGCNHPYDNVGGRCISVDNLSNAPFQDMQHLCEMFGGVPVVISDAGFFHDVLIYIRQQQLDDSSYWIGATDIETEGDWKWVDGSEVEMGTPYWANHGCNETQAPEGAELENCVILDKTLHYYFNDVPCTDKASIICEAKEADY